MKVFKSGNREKGIGNVSVSVRRKPTAAPFFPFPIPHFPFPLFGTAQ